MSFRIEISQSQQVVTVNVKGRFDLSLGFAFWQYCEPEQRPARSYFFNFLDVTEVFDSGLTWLKTFLRWARKHGVRVCLVNINAEIERHMSAVGIVFSEVGPPDAACWIVS